MKGLAPIFALALIFGSARPLRGQNVTANTVQTQNVILPASDSVAQVSSVTVAPSVAGSTVYFYWIVSRTASTVSVPAGPFLANAPAALSSVQNVVISWKPVSGIASYDLLRNSTGVVPSGACGCAVATAVTLTTVTDSGSALSAYTVSAVGSQWAITNQQFAGVQSVTGTYQGTTYQLLPPPVAPGSTVTFTGIGTVGDLPMINTTGFQLIDSLIPANTVATYTGTITPGDLAVWNNSIGKLQDGGAAPIVPAPIRETICQNAVPVTVSNTTTETTLMSCVIPANTVTNAGTIIHLRIAGTNGNSSGSNANYEYRIYLDSNKIADDGNNAVTGDKATAWSGYEDLNILSVGTGGNAEADGDLWITLNNGGFTETPTTTIDNGVYAFNTTIAHTLKVTITLGTASASVAPAERQLFCEYEAPGSGTGTEGATNANSGNSGTALSTPTLANNQPRYAIQALGMISTNYTGTTAPAGWTNLSTVGSTKEIWAQTVTGNIAGGATAGSSTGTGGWNLILSLFPYTATPTLVTTNGVTSTTFPGTLTLASGYTPGAGDTIIVFVKIANCSALPTGISVQDTVNGQYKLINYTVNSATNPSLLAEFGITGVQHSAITLTVTMIGGSSGAGFNGNWSYAEFSGISSIPF